MTLSDKLFDNRMLTKTSFQLVMSYSVKVIQHKKDKIKNIFYL